MSSLNGLSGMSGMSDSHDRIYRAIRTVSGQPVVIDSSKNAPHALVSRRVPGVDLRLAHLALQADDEWSTAMPSAQRRTVTAITWPLLLRHGYRLGGANQEGGRRSGDRGRSG
jgi:hypothetical protein